MKNLNVTEETVKRFADTAEFIIYSKSRLSKKLTRFILDHRSMIEAAAREQNSCAVKRLENAFDWEEFSQSNFDSIVDKWSRRILVYNNTGPYTKNRLDAQIEEIDDIFRDLLEAYKAHIYSIRVLINNHMVSKLFMEEIKKSPELCRQLDDLYSEITQATFDLVDLSSEYRFSIEPLNRSVDLCVKAEGLGVLAPGSEKYLTISQAKKMTFTDLLLQHLSRFA